jgi:hypothetical protein
VAGACKELGMPKMTVSEVLQNAIGAGPYTSGQSEKA